MEILKVCLSSSFSIIALFITAKIMGHKQMSQLDFFDYISGITIGSIAAELATELENPLRPLIAIFIYGLASWVLSIITGKFPRARKFINGTPTIIMNNGKIYRKNLKKAKLDLSEFLVLCRQEGYFNLEDIQTAVFEYNGRLTVLPVSMKRPATPADLGAFAVQEHICTEIIMDGRILGENLKRKGLDRNWLKNQLLNQGIKNQKDVFLAVCDDNNKLTVYKNN